MPRLAAFAATAVFAATALMGCGGDDAEPVTPTPTATAEPTADTRAEPDACKLVTKAEVEAATKKTITSTQTGTKQRNTQDGDIVSFCNFLTADDGGTVAVQVTWGRPPEVERLFLESKPQGARDLPGLGRGAYQNTNGVGIVLVKDSLISVSVPGPDQAAGQAAMLQLVAKAVPRVE